MSQPKFSEMPAPDELNARAPSAERPAEKSRQGSTSFRSEGMD